MKRLPPPLWNYCTSRLPYLTLVRLPPPLWAVPPLHSINGSTSDLTSMDLSSVENISIRHRASFKPCVIHVNVRYVSLCLFIL